MPSRQSPGEGETRRATTGPAVAATSFELVVVEGKDAGARVVLDASSGRVLVGTSPLCELRLTDPTVSRRHASIELTDLGLLVSDLGSTNGSFVGDARFVSAYLSPRARLRVGSTTLEARDVAAEPAKVRRVAGGWRRAARG
jgi:pSer/pThr/pTyr-binding forkhead associated (FHA) protein